MYNIIRFIVLVTCLIGAASVNVCAANKNIAITIDDLPVINLERHSQEEQIAILKDVTAVLAKHKVPATGFVIGKNVAPYHRPLLKEFVRSGNSINNHSYSHLNPNKVPISKYLHDIDKGQRAIKEWTTGTKYYRFPFLFQGRTEKDHKEIREYLASHGYVAAQVTIDNDAWSFNRDYVTALKASDEKKARSIASDYLKHMKEQTLHFEFRAQEVAGRPINQILLLHMSKLNADHLEELLNWYEKQGYQFVTLAEALKDPIYSWQDFYRGEGGISWLDRIKGI